MSRPLLKALGGITAITVTASLLGTAPAQAREPDPSPRTIGVTAKATGPNHFDSSIKVDVPGGGNAQVNSPSLDNKMTTAKVTVSAPLSDTPAFTDMAFIMFQLPSPGKRLIACLTLTSRILDNDEDTALQQSYDEVKANAPSKALAIISYCVRLATLVAQVIAENSKAGRAGTACPALPLGVRSKTEQVNGEYVVSSDGPLTQRNKNSKLKVKCVASGGKYVYTVKPRKKGKTLKSVVGPNLKVGITSPPGSDGAKVKVAFKAP
jgi:hypothetical protein